MEAITAAHEHPEDFGSHPLFVLHSRNPMLVAGDNRRYVDTNAVVCLFLNPSLDAVRKLRIDDLTAPELRPGLDALWSEFLQGKLVARTTPGIC